MNPASSQRAYGPEGTLLPRVEAHGGIETIETPNLVRELAPRRDRRCLRELRELIAAWRPDVVHTHSSKAGILGRAAAWREHVPCVIHTIHGLAFHPYGARWRNAVYILAERYAARRCHRIVCVADAMREQALAAGIGRREQYVTIYSGMEVERFVQPDVSREEIRAELGFADDDFVVGTIARLAELKGHDDLLDGLGETMQKDPRLRLLWVGDGWWRERLLGRLADLRLSDRIVTTGLGEPSQFPKFLQAMDVLAHPSYREGLPRAVTQALLSGTPAVAYDVDGTREICVDGETGRLIRPGDHEALAAAIRWMMDNPDERRAMGELGRERCRVLFDHTLMVDRLEALYDEVLQGG